MGRFWLGFLVASFLWAGGLIWYESLDPAPVVEVPDEVEAPDEPERPARRRRRSRRRAHRPGAPQGTITSGQPLGEQDPQAMDLAAGGGEQRVPASEVEAAFDRAFPQIRRCLLLAAGDEAVTGRLTFGLRIGSDGAVKRVNLRGPAALAGGEAGACLRNQAQSMRFSPYDGPDTFVRYPVTLE